MSGEQNKIRRQNQQNNVQKRLNERFKRLDKKRVRKKPSHTQIYPSSNDNILSNSSGITKSDGNIIVSKKKKKKTVLQRSKTMHHSNSNDQKQTVPINSFKRKHKFNSPKSDINNNINNDINGNRSRSNSVSVKEYLSDGEINQIMSNKIQTRKHSSSLTNRKSYFTKGNNKYTTNSNGRHTISFTNNTSENNILLYKSMININENIEIDEYKEEKKEKEKEKEKEHRSSTSDGLTKIKLSRPNSVPQPRSSVFDVTKRFMSTIIKTNIEEETEEEEEEEEYDSSNSSSSSSNSSIIVLAINIQCTVISAHKYRDNNVEYEIEVTYLNKQWVLYKKFKDFYDLNSSLKRKYKHIKLPTLPTRTRILNTMSSKSILERKENFNNYLQLILKIKEICKCNLLLYFLKIKGDKIHDKYNISIWNKSNYNYNNSYIFSFLYHIGSGNSLGEVENYNNRFLVIRWSSTSVIIHTIMYGIWVYYYILHGIYITYKRRICVSLFLYSWKFLLIFFIVLLGPATLTYIISYIYIINQIWILLTSYQIWILYPCTYVHSVFIIINNYMVFQKANPSRILKVVFSTDNLKCYGIKKVQKCVYQLTSTILTYLKLF